MKEKIINLINELQKEDNPKGYKLKSKLEFAILTNEISKATF